MAVFKNYYGQWEVIADSDADVLGTYGTKEEAVAAAAAKGQGTQEVNWTWISTTRDLARERDLYENDIL